MNDDMPPMPQSSALAVGGLFTTAEMHAYAIQYAEQRVAAELSPFVSLAIGYFGYEFSEIDDAGLDNLAEFGRKVAELLRNRAAASRGT